MADQYVASQTDPDANVTDDCEMVYNLVNLKKPHFDEQLIQRKSNVIKTFATNGASLSPHLS